MSIYSSLNVGVNGINAQSTKIAAISDNISNTTTVGYKQTDVSFKDMLNYTPTYNDGAGVYSPSGAIPLAKTNVGGQGSFLRTASTTDLAVNGNGLFVVSDTAAGGSLVYTRAGSFLPDGNGNFRNDAGYFLKAWRLDANGDVPLALTGDTVDYGTAIAMLETVNVSQIANTPIPTTEVAIRANLDASQTPFDPALYDPADPLRNMAGGEVPPHFSRPFEIVDNTGVAHDFTMGFLKTGTNTWAVEVYAQNPTELAGNPVTGLIASGNVTFNGDGTLASVSPALVGPVGIDWSSATAADSSVTFNYGTAGEPFGTPGATVIGRTDGLSQLDSAYEFRGLDQNGTESGNLDNISIDTDGFLVAQYDNGQNVRLYKIPLAQFRDPSQLMNLTGNVFAETTASNTAFFAGGTQAAYGRIFNSNLENSNVELETQLTELIIAQRAYQANTNTINTADAMFQRLDEMVR